MTTTPSFRHHLYGLSVDSYFPLPGAPVAQNSQEDSDLKIVWSPHDAMLNGPMNIKLSPAYPGAPTVGTTVDGTHVLFWKDEIGLMASPDARFLQVVCREENLWYVPAVLVGIGLGFLLHLRDVLCLHGAVLGRAGRNIIVAGVSGAGKSSIAAAMVRDGAAFYSDDVAAIALDGNGQHRVQYGCMGLRLWDDSEVIPPQDAEQWGHVPFLNKSLWDLSTQALPSELPKLDMLYWLAPCDTAVEIEVHQPLSVPDALRQLIDAWYPPHCKRLLNSRRLAQMAQLAEAVPLCVVRYEQRWDNLPRLLEILK